MPYLIFTDLDGTLLNAETYDCQAVQPVLTALAQRSIPVIPVTSKTRAEVDHLRQALGLRDPFVVENGSAIYVPQTGIPFPCPAGEDEGNYRVVTLGCNYVTARAGLKAMAQILGRPLKGFGDWSVEQVEQLTGLSTAAAKRAKARDFSEPFMTPKNVTEADLQGAAEEMGFRVVLGDRFSHLIGGAAGKGEAVRQLVALYRSAYPDTPLTTLGLGNSPNDIPMLEVVDQPIILPGVSGPHPQLAERGWPVAPSPAPTGWAEAVIHQIDDLAP
ncbi:haloacid dehalogenase [Leptolyngbya sp. BL0902]|uniref:HAD-IIB family hydrolase n=1 Tax=Leptolyngbya sp. BL0902 TaxID=1115757 RepID=UPI0018E89AA4|nr:HAD-IIB family hydrolase [Leptolyngbya sp. BL0902]QQE65240.1 haloacid dehalogenase [Leptolyngbya sp. BL0902]